jgi:chromosomal replication initiation ATPase DnaA
MDAVSANFGVDTAELSGSSRRQQICQARALVSYLAVRELMISGADVVRRMNIDRSTVSRAVGRVQADPALKNMSKALRYPQRCKSRRDSESRRLRVKS